MRIIILALAALSLAATSCNNNSNSDKQAEADQLLADSLRQAEAQQQAIDEQYAAWQADSAAEVQFTSHDLAALEVRGHVKKIAEHQGYTISINESGRVTSVRWDSEKCDVNHNDGKLNINFFDSGRLYTVDKSLNRLAKVEYFDAPFWNEVTYVYDSEGNLTHTKSHMEDEAEGTVENSTDQVTVLIADAHGNWIKRRIGNLVETRSITYYPNALDRPFNRIMAAGQAQGDAAFDPNVGTYDLVGKIGGDGNCVLHLQDGNGGYEVSGGSRTVSVTSFDPASGHLVISAYLPRGKYAGQFDGTYSDGKYTGTFTNYKGGHVTFDLSL